MMHYHNWLLKYAVKMMCIAMVSLLKIFSLIFAETIHVSADITIYVHPLVYLFIIASIDCL